MKCLFFLLPLFIFRCSRTSDIEFCFDTMVNGTVAVNCQIDSLFVPCGVMSAVGTPLSNEEIDFDALKHWCGKSASGYNMLPPDSAFLDWSYLPVGKESVSGNVQFFKKRLKLPPFPRRTRGESYRVSFMIAYQDSVLVRIEIKE